MEEELNIQSSLSSIVPSLLGSHNYQSPSDIKHEDPQIRQLVFQWESQKRQASFKQRAIQKLATDIQTVETDCQKLTAVAAGFNAQIDTLKKQINVQEPKEEEEKQESEDVGDMNSIMEVIKLQEQGLNSVAGLPISVINNIPTFNYEKTVEGDICLFCFSELENNASVKCLPCCHMFHQKCAVEHLINSKYCPACSEEVLIL